MTRKTSKSLVPKKVKRRRRLQFIKKVLLFILVAFLAFELIKLNYYINGQSGRSKLSDLEVLENDVREIREYLLLPSHEEQTSEDNLELAIFNVISEHQKSEVENAKQEEIDKALTTVLESQALATLPTISSSKIDVIEEDNLYSISLDENPAVLIFGTDQDNELYLETPTQIQNVEPDEFPDKVTNLLEPSTLRSLEEKRIEILEALEELNELGSDEEVAEGLSSEGLRLESFTGLSPDNFYEAPITDFQNTEVAKLAYYPAGNNYHIADEFGFQATDSVETIQQLKSDLLNYLNQTEFLDAQQKQVQFQLDHLLELANSDNFQKALKDANLQTNNILQTEEDYRLSIINRSTGQTEFSIVLDKADATLWLDKNGELTELHNAVPFLDQEDLTSGKENFNILVAGKHGSLTDTLILTNINEQKKKVTLISIPRDLFWNGRKINSYYVYYGMDGLVSEIEQMTNTKIDNYVLVDMYAFIDVVDYLGGIDVTLDEAVIDPTYKTYDNGQWGTLYYPPGTHHLSGKQALRLARSRHTSSDFARAKRQHVILESIKEKASELKIANTTTLLKIANSLVDQTETDISPNQAISYFFKYKNYDISSQHVLSTGNILTSANLPTYQGQTVNSNQPCTNCVGMYILKPKGDNWYLIPSFINSILQSA